MQEKCGVVWGGVTCRKNKNRTDGEEASVCLTIYVEQCSINLFFFFKRCFGVNTPFPRMYGCRRRG